MFAQAIALTVLPFLISDPSGPLRAGAAPFTQRATQLGPFTLRWTGSSWQNASLQVLHRDRPTSPEWASVPGRAFVAAARGRERVRESRGSFRLRDSIELRCREQTVDAWEETDRQVAVRGSLSCGKSRVAYTLAFGLSSTEQLEFELGVDDGSLNRVYLVYASDAEERFFGFGEQFTHFDLKGRKVPIVVTEQGIGRGQQPLTALVNLVAGSGGAWHTTYAPVPHYITSRLRSLAIDASEHSTFDLRAPDRVVLEVFAPSMRGRIYHGADPLALIEAHTSSVGRMRPLPDWVHSGAIIGLQGGTERVREAWRTLERQGTPIAAFWLQDWVGQRTTSFGQQLWWNWELDRDRYPAWEELVSDLGTAGIRVMTYVNPFLADVSEKANHQRNLFREAREKGFLVRDRAGGPYMILNTSFSAGLLDLSNPAARAWMLDVLRENVIGAGASGWMADFGEGLPYDAVLYDADPRSYHNRYPEEWAALNRAAIEAAGLGEQAVFFTRSGFTRSPGASTLFWLGDQMVTWDRHDGIKSAVTGLLSGGLSGISFNHSDIGGYTTIDKPLLRYHRSKELMLRWIELAAFQPIFRTHEGNIPAANHQFDSDPETQEHFARFARLHAAWRDYRSALIDEAGKTGAPILRHPFLHDPGDPQTWRITSEEFLVGRDLLVVPVLDPGRDRVRAYLPRGRWIHLWTGAAFGSADDGVHVEVEAPIGRPGVFFREGAAVGEALKAETDRWTP